MIDSLIDTAQRRVIDLNWWEMHQQCARYIHMRLAVHGVPRTIPPGGYNVLD